MIRIIYSLLILISIFLIIYCYLKLIEDKDLTVADFKYDVNKLTYAAFALEESKGLNETTPLTPFATENKVLSISDISPNLKKALIKIADNDNDGKISKEEFASLGIKRLNKYYYNKELLVQQFENIKSDTNLNNFIIVTCGKNAGTILYNGWKKFYDRNNIQYFGLDLYK